MQWSLEQLHALGQQCYYHWFYGWWVAPDRGGVNLFAEASSWNEPQGIEGQKAVARYQKRFFLWRWVSWLVNWDDIRKTWEVR